MDTLKKIIAERKKENQLLTIESEQMLGEIIDIVIEAVALSAITNRYHTGDSQNLEVSTETTKKRITANLGLAGYRAVTVADKKVLAAINNRLLADHIADKSDRDKAAAYIADTLVDAGWHS